MRLLLIDFSLNANDPELLKAMCKKHEVHVQAADTLDTINLADFDAFIVAGPIHEDALNAVPTPLYEALQAGNKPVLGIGVGFGVVCRLAGEDLRELADVAPSAEQLRPTDDGSKIFQGTEPIKVVASPRWQIGQLAKSLAVLAESDSGIEAVRHKKLPWSAIQLLPADFAYASDAKLVLENAISALGK
jgi:anthranilate/para-aminobenzoate synthase component II